MGSFFMGLIKQSLLWASENQFLKKQIPQLFFVKRAVKKFMPGEKIEDALMAAEKLKQQDSKTVFTYLGENIHSKDEAEIVVLQYKSVLEQIAVNKLPAEISLKLTQIGLDLSFAETLGRFSLIAEAAKQTDIFIWIDMEGSPYTDLTIDFYEKIRYTFQNVGLCLQAYLYRTQADLEKLLSQPAAIRLVKGAYKESHTIAFVKKKEVDRNYFELSKLLLNYNSRTENRMVFATHDFSLIGQIQEYARMTGISKQKIEFHLLYGIRSEEQVKLIKQGYLLCVLISYGDAWYPWYMRRLAERPANIFFVLKNIFRK
jgi:proline dehydrogenase